MLHGELSIELLIPCTHTGLIRGLLAYLVCFNTYICLIFCIRAPLDVQHHTNIHPVTFSNLFSTTSPECTLPSAPGLVEISINEVLTLTYH